VTASAHVAQDALLSRLKTHLHDIGWEGRIDIVVPKGALRTHWLDPNLLLSQTCGYPLMTYLRGQVTLLSTPQYRCSGCFGTHYSSRIVVRETDRQTSLSAYRGRIAAINSEDSNSGMNVLRHALIPLVDHAQGGTFFSDIVVSGGHLQSLDLLQTGRVDVAAIDVVTWSLLEDTEPERLRGLQTLAFSADAPALPLIGSRHLTATQQQTIRTALDFLVVHDGALLEALKIMHFNALDWHAYETILEIQEGARNAGVAPLRKNVR
jgi:ABC-type phosphate/phosphonate transport system substrate-binding protein